MGLFGPKRIKCPYCKNTNITAATTNKKFSIGKSLVNGAIGSMINPAGAIIGAATGINGKDGKTTFVCCQCGRVFKVKV